MRQLHVLGVSDDGASLLLGTSENGRVTHRVPLDDRLRSAVRGQLSASSPDRVESALPPREIQARLRAGETPESVAKAAGVPLARVLPYAAPVLAERQRVVDEARAVAVSRPRGPKASRPLGEAVDARLAEVSGFKPDSVEWQARRRPDGSWVVTVTYAARGGRRSASWRWQPSERELTAEDLSASRLAADETVTQRARTSRRAGPARAAAGGKPTGKRATAKRAAKPAAARAPRAAAKQPAGKPAATPKPAATKPVAAPGRAAEPDAAAPETNGARRSRVPVPSWSDVLLGVAPPPRDDSTGRRASRARRRSS
ncbi:MAG TPA: septation protein SepH [Mycobacteriales bacterium]|nr:septation protein SepH [Mycobacteriales bacterium]